MILANTILEFDKREISKEEILENINYYLKKLESARKYAETDRTAGFEILKETRKELELENKYYKNIELKNQNFANYKYILYQALLKTKFFKNNNTKDVVIKNIKEVQFELEYLKNMIQ